MKPLTPKLKEALLRFKTPREALKYSQPNLGTYNPTPALQKRGLIIEVRQVGKAGLLDKWWDVLTLDGVKAWEELQDE